MVPGSRIEGGAQVLSAGVQKTIQTIKEIVGNHSDADIYMALKETNMDPNETAQKLLNQDPFHEVKRKRDRKKENPGCKSVIAVEVRKSTELAPMKFNANSDHNPRSGELSQNFVSGASQEFRVVRDNRVNENAGPDSRSAQSSASTSKTSSGSMMSDAAGTSASQNSSVGHSYQVNGPADVNHRQTKNATSIGNDRKELVAEKRLQITPEASQVQIKANDSQLHFTNSSNSSILGVYSSSSDPVHVPPLNSRVAANVGAIRREVGVVGPRRQQSKISAKSSSSQSTPPLNMQSGQEVHERESTRMPSGTSKSDQRTKNVPPEFVKSRMSTSKSFSSNHHGRRPHKKASQPNKEWKPKSSLKPSPNSPEVIGIPAETVLPPTEDLKKEAVKMQDNMSRLNITENQNVIIAAHIRVSETDRCQLTFGSLGVELDSNVNSVVTDNNGAEELSTEPSGRIPVSGPESSRDELTGSKQLERADGSIRSSGSNSPASVVFSNHQLTEKKESSSPRNKIDSYADVPLVRDNESYTMESLQQQDTSEMQSFSGYDSQMAYNMSYFQPMVDENEIAREHGLPSSQEMSSHHTTNAISASSIAMAQQQQQLAQMYPQHQISQFANIMPYRQFLSPVYGPPIHVPGYSNIPAYPQPSNASSYLLMPGNNSHLSQGGLKYGIQQFKPVVPTGFGNFNSPIGYSMNTSGVVGNTSGLEDSSWLKYKDSFYVPNPQAETSELWMNSRDIPNLQTASYYNMPGQPPSHTYLPSHNNHGSFNAASQSSHMQFPGIYHPPRQPSAVPSHHHLGHTLGGNNAGLAPGAQVGAYQQPQLGHFNWPGNF